MQYNLCYINYFLIIKYNTKMTTTGQQVYQYANPCRLPSQNGGVAVPNYFPRAKGANNNPQNNSLDPYTMLTYWRVRFQSDGFGPRGHVQCQPVGNMRCSYAGLFYPQCYRQSNNFQNGLGWVAPYMGISRKNLPRPSCDKTKGNCTVGYNQFHN